MQRFVKIDSHLGRLNQIAVMIFINAKKILENIEIPRGIAFAWPFRTFHPMSGIVAIIQCGIAVDILIPVT